MNKLFFVIALLCFKLSASDNFFVEFRYNGYNGCCSVPGSIVEKNKMGFCSSDKLPDLLDFWKTKLVCTMWEAEKSASENKPAALEKNIHSLREYIFKIDNVPEKDLILNSCYAIVLESLSRILQSPNGNLLTEELLRTALSIDRLNTIHLRHFYTYANMLILAKRICIYREKKHRLPCSLSETGDDGNFSFDGWGNRIMYSTEGDDFYLFSDVGQAKVSRKISQYVPVFSRKNYNNRLVFSSNMSMRRSQLWKYGKLDYSDLHITLDRKSGTVSYFFN